VCREGNRQVGIAVSHVLDVAAGGDLFEAGTRLRTGGVTLLKNRVTGVVDLGGSAAAACRPNERSGGMAKGRLRRSVDEHSGGNCRKEKAAALAEMCSVRLGDDFVWRTYLRTFLRLWVERGRSRFRWRPSMWGDWFTTAATC
jgi:hypothetical protein